MSTHDETGLVPSNFNIGAISAGDIVFVFDVSARLRDKIVQFVNVTGQRILASIRKTERLTLKLRIRTRFDTNGCSFGSKNG